MKVYFLILGTLLLLTAHTSDAQSAVDPVLSNTGSTPTEYQEDEDPAALAPNLEITDEDSQQMNMASFQIQSNYVQGTDRLVFEETDNIKAVFEPNSGTLYLLAASAQSGVGIEEMQAAMQKVAYQTEGDDPGDRNISVSITVTDLEGNRSAPVSQTVSIQPVNDIPILGSNKTAPLEVRLGREYRIFEDVMINDPDNQVFSRAVIEIEEGFNLDRLIIDDDAEDSALEIVPEARTITISGNADANTYRSIVESVLYEHVPIFSRQKGIRKVSLRLTDANGGISARLSRYCVVQPIRGARINIPPNLKDLTTETDEGSTKNFETAFFEDGFVDINGDRMTAISIASLPQHGTLFLDGEAINNQFVINKSLIQNNKINRLRYQPDSLYYGKDMFRWNASDRENFAANSAQVTIEVKSVNQPPVLSLPAEVEMNEDSTTPIGNIRLNDPDREALKITLEAGHGALFLPAFLVARNLVRFQESDQNGSKLLRFEGPAALAAFALSGLVYSPDENFTGSDLMEVKVDDTDGGKAEGEIEIRVLDVNDAPELLNLEDSPLTYTENEDPILLTETIRVIDVENDLIASATVRISEGYDIQDTLTLETQNEISSNYEAGTLSLSGNASAAVYQNIFRSIRFFSRSENPTPDSRKISFSATDTLGAESEEVSRSVYVEAVNDAPVIANLEENQLGFIANGNPVNITNELTITDIDSKDLEQAVISFVGDVYDPASDLLEFADTEKITASWNEKDGILTLEGTATVAEYQEAIRSVTYRNLSEENIEEIRTLSIVVSDGDARSSLLERALTPNQPPLLSSFEKTTNEDQAFSLRAADFPFQDTDNFPSGQLFGIVITELPAKAVLTLSQDTLTTDDLNKIIPRGDIERLTYRPLLNLNGEDSFGWNASDGASFAESDARANITINPVDDPPVAFGFAVETDEDQVLEFTASQFDAATTDPDGDALASVIIRTTPANGQLLLNNIALPANSQLGLDRLDDLKYIPTKNYAGKDSFTWVASDGQNNSLEAATVSITIKPVNDPPIISNFTRAVQEGEIYNFRTDDFAQHYLDIEGGTLAKIRIRSLPVSGTLLLNGTAVVAGTDISPAQIAALTYQPADIPGSNTISFEWNASDGTLFAENPALVNMVIGRGVTDFRIVTPEDEAYTFSRLQFANNYGNPDAPLQQIRIEELPENGSLLLNGEAVVVNQEIGESSISQLVYQPEANYYGEDTFSWNANGGTGYAEQPALVQVTIEPVNDAPVISSIPDQSLAAGNTSAPITFTVSDLETDAEALSIVVFSEDESIIPAEQIIISGSGTQRSLTLTARQGTQGEVTISVIVSDGDKQREAQFIVEVAPYAVSIATEPTLEICSGERGSLLLTVAGGQPPYVLQTVCAEDDCSATYSEGVITFEPETSKTYFISLVDDNGIRSNVDTVSVTVIDCTSLELEIPTAFTPNGDQVNDVWEIANIQFSEAALVSVYNRYGERVFYAQGYDTPWDGTYENKLLPAGTYYYVISTGGGAAIYNGPVSILR